MLHRGELQPKLQPVIAFSGAACRIVSAGQVGGLGFAAQAAV